jgi:predicted O-methyltransferase YrrM
MVQTKYYDIDQVFAAENERSNFGQVSAQLLRLHHLAAQFEQPTILECGVHEGWSTGVLAKACEEHGGRLISIDINDCSDAISSSCWTFIQSDDTNLEFIFTEAPLLKAGIDLIYIDSRHSGAHVARLIDLYYPHVNSGGYLTFDDIDPGPYMRGQRKDHPQREVAWREISNRVQDFFYANQDDLRLEFHFGSTGLAVMKKLAPKDQRPQPVKRIARRYFTLRSILKQVLGRDL